ncbi:glycosyltransferase family 2 protein [Hydrogenimonas sp. SS33]|uniref:glycosyltransferase family 2 protein n=1 Tax=Hydrogenimonas leucolamina TaxID=2954236 RepID=UPI00336BCCF4
MVEAVSVTILTKNSEKYLAECLDALQAFDEVLILDNGSEDATLSIAGRYRNVTIVEHPFIGFGPMKNLAAQRARNDWIFSVDSDEIVTPQLLDSIRSLDPNARNRVYSMNRLNHYRGKPVRCCGWYPDEVARLYNRTHTRFSDAMVHESLVMEPDTRKEHLEGLIFHYPFDSAAALIEKMQRYSTLYAREHKSASSPAKAFWRASFSFLKNYLFRRGFLCGYEGLLISVSNANGVFYKYIKLYEKESEKRG